MCGKLICNSAASFALKAQNRLSTASTGFGLGDALVMWKAIINTFETFFKTFGKSFIILLSSEEDKRGKTLKLENLNDISESDDDSDKDSKCIKLGQSGGFFKFPTKESEEEIQSLQDVQQRILRSTVYYLTSINLETRSIHVQNT
ncbi:hypothetical protein NQ317_010508 [Molorchus minor]|uniref:Uncharacterized protein n=1 Tax=Molorchus minor TaxID=1323400 RepID=A0ABQ9JPJ4_9CUCU|nr:hypothetical protein NQ317_010508 [Molorchus minor]